MRVLTITNWYPPHHFGGYELSCLDVMLRMIPDLCQEHGKEQCTADEHDRAIEQAGLALYGKHRKAWPAEVRAAAEGRYE